VTPEETRQAARRALACLDLTSLNDSDTAADIVALCQRAVGALGSNSPGPEKARDQPVATARGETSATARGETSATARGAVAAVCVWPRRAALARRLLPPHIAVAAVANFPDGSADLQRAVRDTRQIVGAGAQEVDVVFPYRDFAAAPALLQAVRQACPGLRLKVILETGELQDAGRITQACRIALAAGADFLKTSTGKTPRSATPEAATLMLQAIAQDAGAAGRVGFKPAGGIRTVADAALYMGLTAQHLGAAAVAPARFRIGASSLLDDIEAVLCGRPRSADAARY
jgi:deoxyribose-phosphate aldolase